MHKILQSLFPGMIALMLSPIVEANSPPSVDPFELEQKLHRQINRIRQSYGLPSLDHDMHLMLVARGHSRDMAHRHFFNHRNPQGELPADRAKRQGLNTQKQIDAHTIASGLAENIFLARLYEKVYTLKRNGITVGKEYEWSDTERLVQTIVQGWLDSPHHRKVMLSPQYDRQGIGVAVSGYDIYVTENLF